MSGSAALAKCAGFSLSQRRFLEGSRNPPRPEASHMRQINNILWLLSCLVGRRGPSDAAEPASTPMYDLRTAGGAVAGNLRVPDPTHAMRRELSCRCADGAAVTRRVQTPCFVQEIIMGARSLALRVFVLPQIAPTRPLRSRAALHCSLGGRYGSGSIATAAAAAAGCPASSYRILSPVLGAVTIFSRVSSRSTRGSSL